MSKHTIQQITNYTSLAEASYANFANNKIDLSKQNDDSVKKAIENAIITTNGPEKEKLPEDFARHITDNYQIIAHYADRVENGLIAKDFLKPTPSESSFSATLFQDKNGDNKGQYILAIRGSWGASDVRDTDIGDMFANGVGYEQVVDLYNFYMQLITPVGKKYKAARVLESDDSVLARLTARHQAAMTKLHSMIDNKDNLNHLYNGTYSLNI